ncbi:MAG TPA: hypothetical protein VEP90_26645 [Methylomirabilota bacterium]|nr:hypothetical protein [Methylomirabilota bacterium]
MITKRLEAEVERLHDRAMEARIDALCDQYDEFVELEIERIVEAETDRLYDERDEWIQNELEKDEDNESV